VVGFEGLEARGFDGVENFDVKVLEKRLLAKGILAGIKIGSGDDDDDLREESDEEGDMGRTRKRGIRSANPRVRNRGDDDDGDWD
jgi:hypothetical protein